MGHFSSNRKCSRRPSGIKGLELLILLLRTSCSRSEVVWIKDGGLAFLCMWGPPAALFFPQRAPEQTEKWEGKENDLNYLKVPRGGDAHVNYASAQTPMADRQCSGTNHLCNGKVAWIWRKKNYQDATLSNCISICFGPLFGVVSAAVSQMSHLYPLTQGFW